MLNDNRINSASSLINMAFKERTTKYIKFATSKLQIQTGRRKHPNFLLQNKAVGDYTRKSCRLRQPSDEVFVRRTKQTASRFIQERW